ncbi:MAG: hypothetical protein LBH81_03530 [Rickettsiales bacterium]|jgi:ABC-type transporter Mla subunit MlaD|nr:hypothetical protein [Rickettsiales bacterium]
MNGVLVFLIVAALLLCVTVLFAVAALMKSSKNSAALAQILTNPAGADIAGAQKLVEKMSEKHMAATVALVSKLSRAIEFQTTRAEQIAENLAKDNRGLVQTANLAAEKLSAITQVLDARLANFHKVVGSDEWARLSKNSMEFSKNISELFSSADNLSIEISDRVNNLRNCFDDWTEDAKRLNSVLSVGLESNTAQMNSFNIEGEAFASKIQALMTDTGEKFGKIRIESAGIEETLKNNEKLVDAHMDKIANYTRQSKMLLDQQLGGLTNTASAVGSQIRLAESSIDKQQQILEKSVQTLMEHATDTEGYVKGISMQITTLTGRLQSEVKEMIGGMLENLKQISDNANAALEGTARAEAAFADSVSGMSGGIKDTLEELDGMNAKMSAQAGGMIEMTREVAAQLAPLTELMSGYNRVLPELGKNSDEIAAKLKSLNQTTAESMVGMTNSSMKLEKLTEQSRQMMIELLSDYSAALAKMEKLSGGMESARAGTAAPNSPLAGESRSAKREAVGGRTSDFMASAHGMMEKLNEISVDLVSATNAEVPDQIWDRYRAGDKAVFAKWFAKMVSAADKREFQNLFKTDAAFRGNATQFLRGFHKMLLDASHDENKDAITATLLKTDIGRIYMAMKELIS